MLELWATDRAGNLLKTVPPKVVVPLSAGNAKRSNHPSHTLVSEYEYNGLGQVIRQTTPDGGTSRVWYDQWGRPRFSQDQRQNTLGQYSYVKYDRLGRVVQSGVSSDDIASDAFVAQANSASFPSSGSERTFLVYDDSASVGYLDGTPQHNPLGRLSSASTDDGVTTTYSYDAHGNLEWVAQQLPDFPYINYTRYQYELISGNITGVSYNQGRADAFHHRYAYDQDNRLTGVSTSRDGVIWDRDARYSYSATGDLRRREACIDANYANAIAYFVERGWLVEQGDKLLRAPTFDARRAASEIADLLPRD